MELKQTINTIKKIWSKGKDCGKYSCTTYKGKVSCPIEKECQELCRLIRKMEEKFA